MQGPGKVGMDRVLRPDACPGNAAWNPWFTPACRRRVLQMLQNRHDLLGKSRLQQAEQKI